MPIVARRSLSISKSGFGLMDRDVFGLMDVLDVLYELDALEELWENRPCQARAG